mmetsp:Transcript_7308/g.23985  ORF Transcript_7308/g.23985 Transcript_7308/m.23985 type:complete len:264 (+) Transcript_7308:1305-2096(+)
MGQPRLERRQHRPRRRGRQPADALGGHVADALLLPLGKHKQARQHLFGEAGQHDSARDGELLERGQHQVLVLALLDVPEELRQVEGQVAGGHVAERIRCGRLEVLRVGVEDGQDGVEQRGVGREVVALANLAQAQQRQHLPVRARLAQLLDEGVDHGGALGRLRHHRRAHGHRLRQHAERVAGAAGGVGGGQLEELGADRPKVERGRVVRHQRREEVEGRLERVALQQRRGEQRQRPRDDRLAEPRYGERGGAVHDGGCQHQR